MPILPRIAAFPRLARVLLLHSVRLHGEHWISPLKYPDHPCPADPPTISTSNMMAPASVKSVRISLLLERNTQDFASSRPDSILSMATLVLTKRVFIAQFPALGGSSSLRSFPSLLPLLLWPAFLRHASSLSICAPPSLIAIASTHSSHVLQFRPNVPTPLCGPIVGEFSPGGGTRVPFCLVEDVVAY